MSNTSLSLSSDVAALEGGRYEARYGDGWEVHVRAALAKGEHGLICVTELMQHAIDHGNDRFKDTPYHDSWWIFHDHLSAWWEAGAQQYLADRGFADRQIRAWGDTNSEFARYHWSLVGNRPEMCPEDFHLFNDLHVGAHDNIIKTSHLPRGPRGDPCQHGRYGMGTQIELSQTLKYTWQYHPEPERIVEDIVRWDSTLDLIIQHKGSVIPDALIQHAGCSRTKRKGSGDGRRIGLNPEVSAKAVERQKELRGKARDQARAQGTQA